MILENILKIYRNGWNHQEIEHIKRRFGGKKCLKDRKTRRVESWKLREKRRQNDEGELSLKKNRQF